MCNITITYIIIIYIHNVIHYIFYVIFTFQERSNMTDTDCNNVKITLFLFLYSSILFPFNY